MVGNKYLMCSLNKETNKIRKENLDNLISKANRQLKGIFNFIFNLLYISNNKGYMLSPPNYQAQAIDTLDLTIPANNFSVSEFYPFIFIPDDKMIAHILYREYDYGTFSPNYTKDTMDFYYAFLE